MSFCFFKQKTAYEMRISDWSSDVCSSDLSRAYALSSLVERSELFIGPSTEVYEGMIIGENSRPGDMDVNPTKSKALSKMRTQATDGDYRIHTPPRVLTLESAIEFIAADELVEVKLGRAHV